MFFRFLYIALILLTTSGYSQSMHKYHYTGSDGQRVYLPLGKVSFADKVAHFRIGYPKPISIFRDSSQALYQPDYKGYNSPDFISLGCKGSIILKFTDNGFMNMKGHDLIVFEVGPSRERSLVEVSTDGREWHTAGITQGGTSKLEFDDRKIDPNLIFYYVRIRDVKDECTGKSAGADIDAVAAINSVIRLTVNADVLFDVAEHKLKSSAKETLDSLANAINVVGKATILIEGHTDSDGEEEYNMKLSENRCNSVRRKLQKLLSSQGTYHFEIKPYGENNPRVENSSEENKQINRRVEIMVLPPKDYFDSIPDK